jgi:hypothetical protein
MMTLGGGVVTGSSFGTSGFARRVGCTIGRGGRTASFFCFSAWGLSSRRMTVRGRAASFLPVMRAWITSGSKS